MNCTKKNNSHNALQPYVNQSVFKCLLVNVRLMLLFRSNAGREFHRRSPTTEKLMTPRYGSLNYTVFQKGGTVLWQ